MLSVRATAPSASRATGASGVFTVSRFGSPNGTLAISYTLGGTAVRNVDYTLDVSGGTLSGDTWL